MYIMYIYAYYGKYFIQTYYDCRSYISVIYEIRYFIYLFINYNTITNYILILYELSNFDHLLGVVSQTSLWWSKFDNFVIDQRKNVRLQFITKLSKFLYLYDNRNYADYFYLYDVAPIFKYFIFIVCFITNSMLTGQ